TSRFVVVTTAGCLWDSVVPGGRRAGRRRAGRIARPHRDQRSTVPSGCPPLPWGSVTDDPVVRRGSTPRARLNRFVMSYAAISRRASPYVSSARPVTLVEGK